MSDLGPGPKQDTLASLPEGTNINHLLHSPPRNATNSCQMKRVHRRAFHNLKLIVELDFSRNLLRRIPVVQMGQLSLLRRLSMRGNPLQVLDELTLAPDDEQEAEHGTGEPTGRPALSENASRLYESYPELVRALLHPGQHRPLDQAASELASSLATEFGHTSADSPLASAALADEDDDSELAGSAWPLVAGPDEALDGTPVGAAELQSAARPAATTAASLGRFKQLQELDLGECQLEYIKWDTFKRLDSLKRLQLDGNKLR